MTAKLTIPNTLKPGTREPMQYLLKFREIGKKPGTTRWAYTAIASVKAAKEFMRTTATAQYPAIILTDKKEAVAVLFLAHVPNISQRKRKNAMKAFRPPIREDFKLDFRPNRI